MQDVPSVHLDVLDVEFGFAVDEDLAGVVFLASLLGVEVGSVDYYADLRVGWDVFSALDEGFIVVDSLDLTSDVSSPCEMLAPGPM